MSEEGTLAINADIVKQAGVNVSATGIIEASTNFYIKVAEGKICLDTRYDWVTNYSSVSTIGKEVLREAVSCYAAIGSINYDRNGYLTAEETASMVNVLWARYIDIVKRIVEDNKYKDFILTGSGDID